ncbi:MAG: methanogenesis marker protein Mmp4/MtxX [Methanobacteriaceae archaeon]|nr:methanogenesis marker protein Mmp4/MtxX [Methanobacteriaceae archaeon]MDP2835577.1 methanogenesis marker protein Mmp4/MtxX [Methanobacteriaceae archaeon]MDP3033824.1 methanogenesis marker protein Mmp4/MtxX [Methanobacteriaceae archaeon]MDP3484634.1 methanogenesis marker protein Mmp4/MtxX [Methanobacteriaceae archaeon]
MKTIVIGVGGNKNIIEAAKKVGDENPKINFIFTSSEKELLAIFLDKKADAYVRGSLSASLVMKHIKNSSDKEEINNEIIEENDYCEKSESDEKSINHGKINRASFIKLDSNYFLLAPVGIDEGQNIEEKMIIVAQACDFLKKIAKEPKIAVLSGGRSQDVGRSSQIDKSIMDGEKLTSIIKHKYSVKHYYILIEDAINDKCNLILAPDGISGNLIFRSLVLVGSAESHGAITLGIDQIFIDTSRSQSVEGYIRAINFAHYLAKLKI